MQFSAISRAPNVFVANGKRYHESVLRASIIVRYAVDLLRRGTPGEVVADLIEELNGAPGSELHVCDVGGGA